jgi:hypothetical protein
MSNAYEPETYRISRPTKVALVVAALVVAAEAVTIYLLTQTDDPFWPIAIFTPLCGRDFDGRPDDLELRLRSGMDAAARLTGKTARVCRGRCREGVGRAGR